ncbi:MAG: questin oxidase family protein [Myxococcales bacterium]|nr:questin oxidase family protein [Myxococcales bacterium]
MDALDRGLSRLHGLAPEYGPYGFSNHGPMVVEALFALGLHEAIEPWAENYAPRLPPAPPPTAALGHDWAQALGAGERWADWVALFERELEDASHGEVLRRWLPRLAPGVAAAAFHGLLRVAHATRALDGHTSELRRAELARALAYWAASYLPLGGEVRPAAPRAPSEALGEVARVALPSRGGSITGRLQEVSELIDATSALSLAAPGEDLGAFVSDLVAIMAAVFAANLQHGTDHPIAFVHGVTGPGALRLVLPHLDRPDAEALLRHAFHACAALNAAYGEVDGVMVEPQPAVDLTEAVELAVRCGDEHAIKWIEACVREQRASRQGLGQVAMAVVERLGG